MNKNTEITVRLTIDEREKWKSKAAACGVTLANYIRELMGTGKVKRSPTLKRKRLNYTPVDPQLLRIQSGIGNNLNQIARAVNTAGVGNGIELMEQLVKIERSMNDLKNAH